MNGTIPLAFAQKSGPSWPPSSPGASQQTFAGSPESPRGTAGLSLKKDRLRAPPLPTQPATAQYGASDTVAGSPYMSRQSTGTSSALKSSRQYSDYGSASLSRSQTMPSAPASAVPPSPNNPPPSARKSGSNDPSWVQTAGPLNTRDELLISLMTSEAVIDSREFEILSAEEVEELKKEHTVLTSRLGAMTKKLALETKIRDAALSLSKVNAAHKQVSKQTSEQVDAANMRVEKAQKEVWKISDRVNEVHRRLMEHRAGVLSFSVRNMEKKAESSADSGYDSNRSTMLTSPPLSSSATGLMSPPSARFDGAHLFAGHADTVVPRRKHNAESAMAEIAALEERLHRTRDELNEAGQRQADMARELSMVRLEKQEVETVMGMDLQAAEETIAALENEIPRLEEIQMELKGLKEERKGWDARVRQVEMEKEIWEQEMQRLKEEKEDLEAEVERSTEVQAGGAQHALAELRASSERMLQEKDAEIEELHARMDEAQEAWERERQVVEDEKMEDLARLQEEMDEERARDEALMRQTQEELKAGLGALEGLMRRHNIIISGRDTSLQVMLVAVGRHLETVQGKMDAHQKAQTDWEATRRRMEEEHRGGVDRLSKELIEAQRQKDLVAQELEVTRRESVSTQNAPKSKSPDHRSTPSTSTRELPTPPGRSIGGDSSDAAHIISVLQPLWSILPSPEARASKFSSSNRTFRAGSPVAGSPGGAGGGHGPNGSIATSLSDLDVRSLKSLYQASAAANNSNPGSSGTNGATTPTSPKPPPSPSFTVEAFAARVQALVADDKALIERLVRFAQAHDLLKKNAERAQKLAQDGNHALETYQKQVRMLEERSMTMTARQNAMQDELNLLHETIERLSSEKRELEALAAEQAQTCEQLTEANNTLSARALALAEDAAQSSDMVRKQYESQMAELKKALDLAQEELDSMRMSEQTQRIALLDELNTMQTENGNLRAQLRAAKNNDGDTSDDKLAGTHLIPNQTQNDIDDISPSRPHNHSPTLTRSFQFDPNDPQVRERQRTMDVDMAMQLSLARRETLHSSPVNTFGATSHDTSPVRDRRDEHPFPTSPHDDQEEEEGLLDDPTRDIFDRESDIDGDTLALQAQPSLSNVNLNRSEASLLNHTHHRLPSHRTSQHFIEDHQASNYGLPTYQANVSQGTFNFTPMEEWASTEKTKLGLNFPVSPRMNRRTPVVKPAPNIMDAQLSNMSSTGAAAGSAEDPVASGSTLIPSAPGQLQPDISASTGISSHGQENSLHFSEPQLGDDEQSNGQRPLRHRKLSQSNTTRPRPHRKGIGGKMALFEANSSEAPPSFSARLGLVLGGQPGSGLGGVGGVGGLPSGPSYDHIAGIPSTAGLSGGILNTGHDRPYRFSFYSNALSATIHARSLSELPAEGQTFEQLFTGVQPPAPPPPSTVPQQQQKTAAAEDVVMGATPTGKERAANANAAANTNIPPYQDSFFPPMNGASNSNGINRNGNVTAAHLDMKNSGSANGIGSVANDQDANTWWLDVQNPTDEEMKMLSKVFSIHPLTTEDILMEETREKIELFRNYYLVCFRSFDQDPYSPTHLEPLNMYIIVFREGTLSFHFRPTPHPQNVRRRIKQLKDYISVTSDWISYALIDDITDAFGPLIQGIEYEVDSIDELVLILKEAEQSDMLRRIGTCRKKVMGLLRLMGNKADVVKGLAKRCNENWRVAPTSDIGLYLSDIQDHLITMTQNLNHYEKILSRSHSNYLAQISIEMTDANNQINDVLSKLTALGTILIPMNLVTGLWGMNVHVPGQDVPGFAWFISIIACLAVFALAGGYSTYRFMVRK
ncbi:hypothetical protein D9619_000538 [Psilocybe cf. subviscida]|uniref:Up-regulated during septation protein 1 domain-containing protein n=1 Tax=Psilocybe cf. subviscida TaxID=2480587 RepID=A0A8H5BGA6_9AGAR|nr:hypothetical protein D9619_000538 [Psilocybe cf. subviscida]